MLRMLTVAVIATVIAITPPAFAAGYSSPQLVAETQLVKWKKNKNDGNVVVTDPDTGVSEGCINCGGQYDTGQGGSNKPKKEKKNKGWGWGHSGGCRGR